jgi:hypothetical protein
MFDRETAHEVYVAAKFEPVLVRRPSTAGSRLVTAAWLVGLVGVAGLAVVGRLTEIAAPNVPRLAVESTPAPIAPRRPSSAPTPHPSGMHHLATIDRELIVVTSPAEGRPTITAYELIVQGFLQDEAASLVVTLETGSDEVDEARVVPALAFGERPGATRHAQFLVRFELPDPRPVGPMAVRVVAFDRDGERLVVVRQPFRLGPLSRPTLGDDGLVGGLVFSGG